MKTCLGRVVAPPVTASTEHTVLELTGADRPGILSELSAVIVKHGCQVISGQAWTHNSRAACILYLDLQLSCGPRLKELEDQLEHVVAAHHGPRERWLLRLRPAAHATSSVHTERRLHQLMHEDRDFEEEEDEEAEAARKKMAAKVSIESCREKGYSVVGIRSRDRPKLLFDTVCTLTDLDYVVFHATVSSHGPVAVQVRRPSPSSSSQVKTRCSRPGSLRSTSSAAWTDALWTRRPSRGGWPAAWWPPSNAESRRWSIELLSSEFSSPLSASESNGLRRHEGAEAEGLHTQPAGAPLRGDAGVQGTRANHERGRDRHARGECRWDLLRKGRFRREGGDSDDGLGEEGDGGRGGPGGR